MIITENISKYTLMNKDEPVLDFECQRNIYDEPEFSELEWRRYLTIINVYSLI